MITIIDNTFGNLPRTDNCQYSNISTHIAAKDQFSTEATVLQIYADEQGESESRDPIAVKFSDPTEGARLIFDESDLSEIEKEDPSLIERINVIWE